MNDSAKLITVIGRGHSGTRAIALTLQASGVYMGGLLNESTDMLPPQDMYEACRVLARYVKHRGGTDWDFSDVLTGEIDPQFVELVESYLEPVLANHSRFRGWKLPETTLAYPWIARMFPDVYYIHWYRDPRDSILSGHTTDDLADFGVPYDPTSNDFKRRAISWKYQSEIMDQTVASANVIRVRFEDFVLDQENTLRTLEEFLGFALARIAVRPESVGRWKTAGKALDFSFLEQDLLKLGYG